MVHSFSQQDCQLWNYDLNKNISFFRSLRVFHCTPPQWGKSELVQNWCFILCRVDRGQNHSACINALCSCHISLASYCLKQLLICRSATAQKTCQSWCEVLLCANQCCLLHHERSLLQLSPPLSLPPLFELVAILSLSTGKQLTHVLLVYRHHWQPPYTSFGKLVSLSKILRSRFSLLSRHKITTIS